MVFIPPEIEQFLGTSHPDSLGRVLEAIDKLPAAFKGSWPRYFETEELDGLRQLHSGLIKLRDGRRPTKGELLQIAHPEDMLTEVWTGMEDAAAIEPLKPSVRAFFEQNVRAPLEAAAIAWGNTPLIGRAAGSDRGK
jgi:hypothetical protein